jgi:hypothetical protein
MAAMDTRPLRLALGLALSLPLAAQADGGVLAGAKFHLDLRYRMEMVEQAGFTEDALASTLRARFGVTTADYAHFSALLEYESVVNAGADDYNDFGNGKVLYPAISDPTDHEVNQAYLQWANADTRLRYGRQRLVLDNHRFVGNVGFRQNEQTFDGLSVSSKLGDLTVTLAHLDNANRIFGANHPVATRADQSLDLDLFHVAAPVWSGTLSAYAHLIGLPDAPLTSHRNLGVRYAGEHAGLGDGKVRVAAEFAQQRAYDGGAASIDQDYQLLELGYGGARFGFRVGNEVLGGDGVRGFQTPLATLHAFNGWADRFLVTPVGGLADRYLKFDGRLGKAKWLLARHDFNSDAGSVAYGEEWNLSVAWPFDKRTSLKFEYADYSADGFATDTRIVWLTAEYRY